MPPSRRMPCQHLETAPSCKPLCHTCLITRPCTCAQHAGGEPSVLATDHGSHVPYRKHSHRRGHFRWPAGKWSRELYVDHLYQTFSPEQDVLKSLEQRQVVTLIRQPWNVHDDKAVSVQTLSGQAKEWNILRALAIKKMSSCMLLNDTPSYRCRRGSHWMGASNRDRPVSVAEPRLWPHRARRSLPGL